MTPYQRFKRKWSTCKRCELHTQRRRLVLARGAVPCDVLFVGEAPGASEDVLGKPFVGPAGHLMQRIIDLSLEGTDTTYALTNLVACYPREAKAAGTNEPSEKAIDTCSERLEEFIRLCKPDVIVAVGKLAAQYIGTYLKHDDFPEIIHPASILRMDRSQRGLAVQRSVVIISDALVPF